MDHHKTIEHRKPIWNVFSEFYLDTELQESDFRHIAFKIIESPYSFEKVKEIRIADHIKYLQYSTMYAHVTVVPA